MKLPNVLPSPSLPEGLDPTAQWLAGEGAGSWFVITPSDDSDSYKIERFSPSGRLECSGHFRTRQDFQCLLPFVIDYPSHCATVTVIQGTLRITLSSI